MKPTNQDAEQFYQLGLQLLHSDKIEQAIAAFTKAIAIAPDFADAYYYRGELLTMAGRIVEGNTDLQKAKALRSGATHRKSKENVKIGKYNGNRSKASATGSFRRRVPQARTRTSSLKTRYTISSFPTIPWRRKNCGTG